MQARFSWVPALVFVAACAGGTSGAGGSGGTPGQGGNASGGSSGTAQSGGASTSNGGVSNGGTSSGGSASGGATSGGSSSGGSSSGGSASGGVSSGGGGSQGGSSAAQGGGSSGGVAMTSGGTAGASAGGSASGGRASGGAGGVSASGGTTASSGGAGGAQSGGAGGSGGGTASACVEGSVGAYFIDSAAGNDSNNGTSPATAWRSLSKVNATTFQAGNRICFKAGSSFSGQLWPKGSGKSGSPIVIDQYGSGAKPIIAAGSSDAETVRLFNQQYWEITNLEVTNKKSALGDYRGIAIIGQNGGTLNHVYVKGCNVHDVSGHVNWIGGDVADNLTGVTFQTGWDASKRTGGIVFDVQSGSGTAVKTLFNDVLVEGNTVQNTSFGGIIFKQLDGTVHWGVRSSSTDTNWTPHTNVTVRGNYLSQLNTDYGCNGIYMTDVKGGLIENNVVNGAGTSAIELYYTDSVTIQKNEAFATKKKANGADWNGIDTDKATTNSIIQYNWVHDNGDGIMLCQFAFGSAIVRYNILQNNSRYQVYLHSDAAATASVYNNTLYNNKANSGVVYGYGDSLAATYALRNNIFVAAAGNGVLTTGGGITYQNNLYFGSTIAIPSGDSKPLNVDPKLVSPGSGSSGSAAGPAFSSLGGYKLQSGSPAINAGASMASNGGVDFWGNPLYTGAADIGAFEAP